MTPDGVPTWEEVARDHGRFLYMVAYRLTGNDEDGNPLATTFMDYLLPTASDVPDFEIGHVETFAPTNPGGHKGMGEGGAIGAPPAICNALLMVCAAFEKAWTIVQRRLTSDSAGSSTSVTPLDQSEDSLGADTLSG